MFKIQTKVFEGPIALLHELIEKRELSVSEFSLVSITEDFIDFVRKLDKVDKEEISGFIVVASVLILMKSKSMLPSLELTPDENRDVQILESQIKCFEILKDRSKFIKSIWKKKILLSASVPYTEMQKLFVPHASIEQNYFYNYILDRIKEITPKKEDKKEIKVHRTIKIEDALSHVRNIIKRIKTLNFKTLHHDGDTRLQERNKKNVVILFLAVLELVKMGELNVVQNNLFDDIIVSE
jgi:segregation and condensation protein A